MPICWNRMVWRGSGIGIFLLIGCMAEKPARERAGHELFDGRTLAGWTALDVSGREVPAAESGIEVRDGCLVMTGKGKAYWLASRNLYGDFRLHLECRISEQANSGIFLRVPETPGHPGLTGGLEIQILDSDGEEPSKNSAGAIYDVAAPEGIRLSPRGEWNTVEVTCRGRRVEAVWNGVKIIDEDLSRHTELEGDRPIPGSATPLKGRIGLQNYKKSGEVGYRRIRIQTL